MAENEGNTQETAAAEQPAGPQFALQRIYLKDSSFESPGSPAVFQGEWQPKINFDIKTRNTKMQDDLFEVVLVLTVEATQEDKPAFVVEVHQAGVFTAKDFEEVTARAASGHYLPKHPVPLRARGYRLPGSEGQLSCADVGAN